MIDTTRAFVPFLFAVSAVLGLTAAGCGGAASSAEEVAALRAQALTAGSLVIEAESYASTTGVVNHGSGISYVDHGDWVRYAGVNFGAAGTYARFTARMATPYAGNRLQVRLGSPTGALIADLTTAATADFSSPTEQSVLLSTVVSGVHDVYVMFDGAANQAACQTSCWQAQTPACPSALAAGCGSGVGNFDRFAFSPDEPTVLTLGVSQTNLVAYQMAVYTGTVKTTAGAPVQTGAITFSGFPGLTGGGLVVNAQGTAGLNTFLPAGTHVITATYAGTGFAPSSTSLTVIVGKANTTTTATYTPNPIPYAELGTYMVSTVANAPSAFTGYVSASWADYACFRDGVPFDCIVGNATEEAGAHTIRIDFLGNANFNASSGSVTYERLPPQ